MIDNKYDSNTEDRKFKENNSLINNNPRTEESKVSDLITKEAKEEEDN